MSCMNWASLKMHNPCSLSRVHHCKFYRWYKFEYYGDRLQWKGLFGWSVNLAHQVITFLISASAEEEVTNWCAWSFQRQSLLQWTQRVEYFQDRLQRWITWHLEESIAHSSPIAMFSLTSTTDTKILIASLGKCGYSLYHDPDVNWSTKEITTVR